MKKTIYYSQDLSNYESDRPVELRECKGFHLIGGNNSYMNRIFFNITNIPKNVEIKSATLSFYMWLTNCEYPAPDNISMEFYKIKNGNELGQIANVPDKTFSITNERVLFEHDKNVVETKYFYDKTINNIDVTTDIQEFFNDESINLGWLIKLPDEYKTERVLFSSETRLIDNGFPNFNGDFYYVRPFLTIVYVESGKTKSIKLQNNDSYNGNKILGIYQNSDTINVFQKVTCFDNETFENQISIINQISNEFYVITPIDSLIHDLSEQCQAAIYAGADVDTSYGLKHFSFTLEDQMNLKDLKDSFDVLEGFPYHADGDDCLIYTKEDIQAIITAKDMLKLYHTTYFNQLKQYIMTLDDISSIYYGIELPEPYLNKLNDVMNAAGGGLNENTI